MSENKLRIKTSNKINEIIRDEVTKYELEQGVKITNIVLTYYDNSIAIEVKVMFKNGNIVDDIIRVWDVK